MDYAFLSHNYATFVVIITVQMQSTNVLPFHSLHCTQLFAGYKCIAVSLSLSRHVSLPKRSPFYNVYGSIQFY